MKLIPALEAQGVYDTVVTGLDILTKNNETISTEDVLDHLARWKISTNGRPLGRLGQCDYGAKEVEIHSVLLKAEEKETRIAAILHEVAHAVAKYLFKHRGHGPAWKRTMVAFGQDPSRTLPSDAIAKLREKRANYVYACSKCGVEHYAQRRKKRPAREYSHVGCGGRLYIKSHKPGKSLCLGDRMHREQLKKEGKI